MTRTRQILLSTYGIAIALVGIYVPRTVQQLGGHRPYFAGYSLVWSRPSGDQVEERLAFLLLDYDEQGWNRTPDWVQQALSNSPLTEPVSEARKRWPGISETSDRTILAKLSDPKVFRTTFPDFANLSDEQIQQIVNASRQRAQRPSIRARMMALSAQIDWQRVGLEMFGLTSIFGVFLILANKPSNRKPDLVE